MLPTLAIINDHHPATPFRFDGFGSLLAPIGKQRFLANYWERQPFLIQRGQEGYFASIMTMADIDALVGSRVLRQEDVRLAKDHNTEFPGLFRSDGVANRGVLLREFANGATLVFDHITRHHLTLDRILTQCETELQIPMLANTFVTPPQQNGFNFHYDRHDVIVLQLEGSKTWKICNDPLGLPHYAAPYDWSSNDRAVVIAEITMHPGDVLYLPRGYIHAANSNDTTSLHVSIAMRNRALREASTKALLKAVMQEPAMRKVAMFRPRPTAAQLADLRQQLHALVDQTDLAAAFDGVLRDFAAQRRRPMDGQLMAMEQATSMTHNTPLRVRPEVMLHPFTAGDGQIALVSDGSHTILPTAARQAIDFMQTQPSFTPAQLPGIELESQLILCQKLQRQGFLQICPH